MHDHPAIRSKILSLPDACGVYLIKGYAGKVIYVGKAKSLKRRLISYLAPNLPAKTSALMRKACDIEYRLAGTEAAALLLEAKLVRSLKPKYNISLRDDKSFPYVNITREEFPRVYIGRKKDAGSNRLIGPYTSAKILKAALKSIRRVFPFRSCKALAAKACIYQRIKLCPSPCAGKVSRQEYAREIEKIALCLSGKIEVLIGRLSRLMRKESRNLDFEGAALLRDQISSLSILGGVSCAASRDGPQWIKQALGLKDLPQRIEGFDISNISGQEASGSLVSFYAGLPDKKNYRRFRIKEAKGINDYMMLEEVVRRRYSRLIKEGGPAPDLVIIDGGKGHLQAASGVLAGLGLRIPVISIAKEHENIYVNGRSRPLKFSADNPALNLIRRVRDEAHRFAVSYHHLLRRRKVIGR